MFSLSLRMIEQTLLVSVAAGHSVQFYLSPVSITSDTR